MDNEINIAEIERILSLIGENPLMAYAAAGTESAFVTEVGSGGKTPSPYFLAVIPKRPNRDPLEVATFFAKAPEVIRSLLRELDKTRGE